jgi:CRP-like cAMP-binding protein
MAAIDRSLVINLPLFAEVADHDLDEILLDARAVRYPKNAHIFEQGADAPMFFLLVHGHVRAEKSTPSGEQIVVRYISPGEPFGIARALGLTRYPATAIAVVDCLAIAWPTAAWDRLVAKCPQIAVNTLQIVGGRLQQEHTRILEISTQQVEQRIANALLRLANQAGRKTETGIEIDFPISRQDIAEMTGTTLHTVSRILSGWEQSGLVQGAGRQRVVLCNPQKLQDIAQQSEKSGET